MDTSQAPADPSTSVAVKQAKCSICADPRLSDINASLAAHGIRKTSRDMDLSLPSLQRHSANHLAPRQAPEPEQAKNETLRQAEIAERIALRNARRARNGTDIKASNGAITSLVKAIELGGKARKELQPGTQVNLTLTTVQQVAVDAHAHCVKMSTRDITVEAIAWLEARVGAGDAHACAEVGRLAERVASVSTLTQCADAQ